MDTVYINYDKLDKFVGVYPRSQVSVYRTIGPLVFLQLTDKLNYYSTNHTVELINFDSYTQ